MNKREQSSCGSGPDPEHLLRARLRDTTPEFEARFDALRRRLAHEPRPARWLIWPGWLARPPVRGAFAAAAVAVVVAVYVLTRPEPGSPHSSAAEFGEIVALDDALRDAMPLIDTEILETLLLMPSESKG